MPLTPLAAPADGVLPLLVATRIRVHIHQKATPGVVGHRVHDDRRVGACRGRAGQVVDVAVVGVHPLHHVPLRVEGIVERLGGLVVVFLEALL